MSFVKVSGLRYGTHLFSNGDGFYYTVASSNNVKDHFKCYKHSCSNRVFVVKPTNIAEVNRNFPDHNHCPEPSLVQVHNLRDNIINRVKVESPPLKQIFDEECNRVPVEISQNLSYGHMESTLRKSRRKCFPSLPATINEMCTILQSDDWRGRFGSSINGSEFYRTNLEIEGHSNIIFLSENLKTLLGTSEELHIDGTFKTVPTVPGLRQLLVIMPIAYDHAFPVCFVLMEEKSFACYRGILEWLKQAVPVIAVQSVVTDYEAAILKAIDDQFPGISITGCWWHYANRIYKRSKRLRLLQFMKTDVGKKILHMCMALPLLPSEHIHQGLQYIREVVALVDNNAVAGALVSLMNYIQRQWIEKVGVDRVSVYKAPRRTNNVSESFNRTLRREIGLAHPNAWSFIEHLKNIENTSYTNLLRCQDGRQISRAKKRTFLAKDNIIRTAEGLFDQRRITIQEFLLTVAAVIGRYLGYEDEDEEEENEEEDLGRPPSPAGDLDAPILAQALDERHDMYGGLNLDEYRLKPIILNIGSITTCPPQNFVNTQLAELAECLQEEESVELGEPVCIHCLSNRATRVTIPCGHWAGCAACCRRQIDVPINYFNHLNIEITNIRLPIRCHQCSCLVGRYLRVFN